MKIAVLGGAESGIGAAVLAKVKGQEVFLSDCGKIKDSYAEEWANKHQIPFLADDIWHVAFLNAGSHSKPIKLVVRFLGIIMLIIFIALYRRGKYFERSKRPQDRPELNPIDYCFP